jgi:hypothetical protein
VTRGSSLILNSGPTLRSTPRAPPGAPPRRCTSTEL